MEVFIGYQHQGDDLINLLMIAYALRVRSTKAFRTLRFSLSQYFSVYRAVCRFFKPAVAPCSISLPAVSHTSVTLPVVV